MGKRENDCLIYLMVGILCLTLSLRVKNCIARAIVLCTALMFNYFYKEKS